MKTEVRRCFVQGGLVNPIISQYPGRSYAVQWWMQAELGPNRAKGKRGGGEI